MKSFSTSAAVLAGGLMFAGTASGAVFFEDFESGSGNWATPFGTYTSGQNYSGDPHTSVVDGGALYGHTIGVASPVISNAVAIGAGETQYNFSSWLAAYTSDAGTDYTVIQVQFYSDVAGSTQIGGLVELASGDVEGSSTTPSGAWNNVNWSLYTASGTVEAGAQSFRVLYGGPGNDTYADNLSFETSAVPEPGSLALLGLGGLALLRRRR